MSEARHQVLVPLALPSFTEAAPRLLAAAPGGQLVLAVRDGRSLYACNAAAGTQPEQPAAVLLSHHSSPVCALAFTQRRGRLFLVALQVRYGLLVWNTPIAKQARRPSHANCDTHPASRRTRLCAPGGGPPRQWCASGGR
jgi:hypothetical protein